MSFYPERAKEISLTDDAGMSGLPRHSASQMLNKLLPAPAKCYNDSVRRMKSVLTH